MHPSIKKILQTNSALWFQGWLTSLYIRFVFYTTRWQFDEESVQPYWDSGTPYITCFWHNRLTMMPFAWRHKGNFFMLISKHRGSFVISEAIRHLGISTIFGSTSKGASTAIRQILRTLRSGGFVGVTPDGPRGPRFTVNPNLVEIAARAGADIIPATFSLSRMKVLQTWDLMLIPLPFSRGIIKWGNPIKCAAENPEKTAAHIEQMMRQLCDECDSICGHPNIEHDHVV